MNDLQSIIKKILSSKLFHSFIGFIISATLIGWLYYAIEWQEVMQQLQQIAYWMLIPVTALMLLHYYLRALRWRYLLPAQSEQPTIQNLFDSIIVGTFASYILPLRAGEFVRPYILTRISKTNFSVGFASVVIERFFDLATVLFTFAVVMQKVGSIPDWVQRGALLLSFVAIGIFVFIVVGSFLPGFVINFSRSILKVLPEKIADKIIKFIEQILSAAQVVSNFVNLSRVVLLTLLIWASGYLGFYVLFLMFPGEHSILMSVTTAVIVALAVAAPSAPGFIGVYQTACIAGVQLFGYSKEFGASYSIVSHVYQYVFFTLLSMFFFLRSGIAFKDITTVKR